MPAVPKKNTMKTFSTNQANVNLPKNRCSSIQYSYQCGAAFATISATMTPRIRGME